MLLEHLVEGWIEDYEAKGMNSALFRLVKSSVELTRPKKRFKPLWQRLMGAVSSMREEDSSQGLVTNYLLWRLPNWRWTMSHRKADVSTLIDELYVLFYLQGQLPRTEGRPTLLQAGGQNNAKKVKGFYAKLDCHCRPGFPVRVGKGTLPKRGVFFGLLKNRKIRV